MAVQRAAPGAAGCRIPHMPPNWIYIKHGETVGWRKGKQNSVSSEKEIRETLDKKELSCNPLYPGPGRVVCKMRSVKLRPSLTPGINILSLYCGTQHSQTRGCRTARPFSSSAQPIFLPLKLIIPFLKKVLKLWFLLHSITIVSYLHKKCVIHFDAANQYYSAC